MKKVSIFFICILLSTYASGQDQYTPTGYVNDFADILNQETEENLENEITEYEKSTSIEIAVVTVPSLNGLDVNTFTDQLAHEWGVGKADKDNGLVLLVAPTERQVRISVGYGLEPDLTDGQAGFLLDQHAIPHFRDGDYSGGIVATVSGVINHLGSTPFEARLEERRIATEQARIRREQAAENFKAFVAIAIPIIGILIVLFIIFRTISSWLARRNYLKKLHNINLTRLSTLRDRLTEAQNQYSDTKTTFNKLKSENPESVWTEFVNPINNFPELKHEVLNNFNEIKSIIDQGWKNSETADLMLKIITRNVDVLGSLNKDLRSYILKLNKAERKSRSLLGDLPDLITSAEKMTDHKDVTSPGIKDDLVKAVSNLTKLQKDVTKPRNKIDWFIILSAITLLVNTVENIEKTAQNDRETANRARLEGPGLFKKIPDLISEAESAVSHSDVGSSAKESLDSAKARFDKIQRDVKSGSPWPIVFTGLLGIGTLLNEAIRTAKNDKSSAERRRHRRNSYSSPSYSSGHRSSSSSSSFGGFGGGGFGGGGSSRGW